MKMPKTTPEQNKALVLKSFDTLFNQRDYAAAERFWSPDYIQHSAHIEPGREGLFNLINSLPATLKYEAGAIVAEGDFVIVHGRFSGFGAPVNWIAADVVRMQDGSLVEHWDVIQDEVSKQESKSGLRMFGEELALLTSDLALDWIAELKVMDWPSGELVPDWRRATLSASARLGALMSGCGEPTLRNSGRRFL
jgi:predicted SnoaL-like aldol condensation-catalyzing enzyme